MQREELPAMATGLERIAAKARSEPKLCFTTLAHRITGERVWENLCRIPKSSAPGVDGQTVTQAKESFEELLREFSPWMTAPLCRAPSGRAASEALSLAATQAASPLPGVASYRCAVK